MKNINMKGIVLAGGTGSRVYPLTRVVNKHLLPVYDKPLIYYPISTLMIAGIRDIIIICRSFDLPLYKELLGDGRRFGISLSYQVQDKANGIAEALILSETFINNSACCLVLGDNIFFGAGLKSLLFYASENAYKNKRACIFSYWVSNPKEFAVIEFYERDKAPIPLNMSSNILNIAKNAEKLERIKSITEKPLYPKSNFAVPGLYFYNEDAVSIAKEIKPSNRGELEITDVNAVYLTRGELDVCRLNRNFVWIDAGSPSSILNAGQYLESIEKRQGLKIACLEEIAFHEGWINDSELLESIDLHANSTYGEYLKMIHLLESPLNKKEISKENSNQNPFLKIAG
jgi:glucose-1-phosphate thymidylyltransferase